MKRISRLGPLTVVHNGSHFEMPDKRPVCHSFACGCECGACSHRKKVKQPIKQPWEVVKAA